MSNYQVKDNHIAAEYDVNGNVITQDEVNERVKSDIKWLKENGTALSPEQVTNLAKVPVLESQLDEKVNKNYLREFEIVKSRHCGLFSNLAFKPQIGVVLGDSIAQGTGSTAYHSWSYVMAQKLAAKYGKDVWAWNPTNLGQGGKTITNCLAHCSYDFNNDYPVLTSKKSYIYNYPYAFIMTGRNDWQVLTPEEFEYYYRLTVRMLKKNNIDVICCTEPALVDMVSGDILDGVGNNTYPQYAQIIRDIAETEGCSLLDLYKEWCYMKNLDGIDLKTLTTDGCHPNDQGHDIIANLMFKLISKCPTSSTINTTNMNFKYDLVPQITLIAPSGDAVLTDVSTQAYTTYYQRTNQNKAYKLTNGQNCTFAIPQQDGIEYIIVNIIENISTGKLEVQSPIGMKLGETQIVKGLTIEKSYIFKVSSNVNFPSKTNLKLICSAGDVFITSVGVISNIATTIQNKPTITHLKVGNWGSNTDYLESTNIGDKISFRWFGTVFNCMYTLANWGGKFKITTDGDSTTEKTIDSYRNIAYTMDVSESTLPLKSGWHITTIEVLDKNAASSEGKVRVTKNMTYDIIHNKGVCISNVDENSILIATSNFDQITSNVAYNISNNTITFVGKSIIETKTI